MTRLKWKLALAGAHGVLLFAVLGIVLVLSHGTSDPDYPKCAAFSGPCDPEMVWRFALYSGIALLAFAGGIFSIGKIRGRVYGRGTLRQG